MENKISNTTLAPLLWWYNEWSATGDTSFPNRRPISSPSIFASVDVPGTAVESSPRGWDPAAHAEDPDAVPGSYN